MAFVKSKGTLLQYASGNTYATLSQIVSLDGPELQAESVEFDTLDNNAAGIPYEPTGRTEGGKVSGELFFDPALAAHKILTGLLTTPAKINWNLAFADTNTTDWPFSGADVSLKPTAALKDGLKAAFSIKLNGIPTLPA